MDLELVQQTVAGVPNMTASEGRAVYAHLVASGARDVLELGTAHGVSAAYMAAAVGQRGGRVVTVDHAIATAYRDPSPVNVLERAGVAHLVDRVLVEDSSYTWWLKEQVAERSETAGMVRPAYDFCYVDGAHNWTIDGLAVLLVEKLLRPHGWLLLDDLQWTYGSESSTFGADQGPEDLRLSAAERSEPHIQAVFDLLVRQHPSFSRFRVENGRWAWAQKDPSGPRELEVVERSVPLVARLRRRFARTVRSRASATAD